MKRQKRYHRIIDGKLYDTKISDYLYSVNRDGNIVSKDWHYIDYYICKDGTIFKINHSSLNNLNDLQGFSVLNDEESEKVKQRIKPEIYKKYFKLFIPGKSKEEVIPKKSNKRLSKISGD